MKYIKKFRLFENLESEIDLKELEELLIDFKQMGLDYDIKVGSSSVIDWNLFNDDKHGGPKVLRANEIDKYRKSFTNNSLTIEFTKNDYAYPYDINNTIEAYEMLKDYLFRNYDLIPNYIYRNYNWSYMYFEDFDKMELRSGDSWIKPENTFRAHKLTFGFYK